MQFCDKCQEDKPICKFAMNGSKKNLNRTRRKICTKCNRSGLRKGTGFDKQPKEIQDKIVELLSIGVGITETAREVNLAKHLIRDWKYNNKIPLYPD